MAVFYPSFNEIMNNCMEKPTEGELDLLKELQSLSDDFEIYFQAHINLAHPDIVILKKGCGALIIEVKDWNLDAYDYIPVYEGEEFGVLVEKSGGSKVTNPFQQAHSYKDELYKIYCPALRIGRLSDKRSYGIIKAGVYFYNAVKKQVMQKFGWDRCTNKLFMDHYFYFTRDNSRIAEEISCLMQPKSLFTDDMYEQIKSVFVPSQEMAEQAQMFSLSKEQAKFTVSSAGRKQKIKGTAGSGKTLVLAQRAINCFKRIQKPVLILTFNLTLPHYITDKIAQNSRETSLSEKRGRFHIMPIHDFVKRMLEKNNIYYKKVVDAAGTDPDLLLKQRFSVLLENESRIKEKYEAILIDEVQDFEYDWLKMIERLFLAPNGEMVLFGDEKQNIYNRELNEKRLPRTNILGTWSKLTQSYRLTRANGDLADKFQKKFFAGKYEDNESDSVQLSFGDFSGRNEMRYYDIRGKQPLDQAIYKIIEQFRNDGEPIAFNDICILSANCETLRKLECFYRKNCQIQSVTTCETSEEYHSLEKLLLEGKIKQDDFDNEVKELRRMKKYAFRMNPGVMKMSTVHSFKGWEIHTIFLVTDGSMESGQSDEVVYTAITRAKKNLVIINAGNCRYHEFFAENVRKRSRLFIVP